MPFHPPIEDDGFLIPTLTNDIKSVLNFVMNSFMGKFFNKQKFPALS